MRRARLPARARSRARARTVGESWPLTAFTSMFMHGGWVAPARQHALPLDLRQQRRGRARARCASSLFYVAGGLAATALQTVRHARDTRPGADATIPNVGASGAISAVLGAYLVLLPARASSPSSSSAIFFVLREIPAVLFLLGLWFVFQLARGGAAIAHPEQGGGVAFFAHVGGFLFGALLVKLVAADASAPARLVSTPDEPASRITSAPRSTCSRPSSPPRSRTSRSSSRTRTPTTPTCSASSRGSRSRSAERRLRPAPRPDRDLPPAARGGVPRPGRARDEIRITVLHELAHYFGIDEDRIAELGYE